MNHEKRLKSLREVMETKQVDVCFIWEPDNQYYFTGFRAISYSRPIFTWITKEATALVIPELEQLHAEEKAVVNQLYIYYERMDKREWEKTALDYLKELLSKFPTGSNIGVEMNQIPANMYAFFYEQGYELTDIEPEIIAMRSVKDEAEIEYIKIAGYLSDVAIRESLQHAKVGISELQFDAYGDRRLLEEASNKYPDEIIGYEDWTCSGIERSIMPHLYSSTRKFANGDVIIHSRQVWINGYRAENERTFFIGKPTDKQIDLLKLAIEAQQVGIEMIRPGILAKEVDMATYNVFKKSGYGDYVNHRVGHGIGLSEHEEPYLRFDNDLVLKEGMVYTIEPGIYVPGLGGYRHSDTVILTEKGSELVTRYPRDIDNLLL